MAKGETVVDAVMRFFFCGEDRVVLLLQGLWGDLGVAFGAVFSHG